MKKLGVKRALSFFLAFVMIITSGFIMPAAAKAEGSMTVAEAIANNSGTATVRGYIVGTVTSETAVSFESDFSDTNFAIADSPEETDLAKILYIQLPAGLRENWSLQRNPSLLGTRVDITGSLEKYFGSHPGLKGTKSIVEVTEEPQPTTTTVTIHYGNAKAAEEGYDVWLFAKGVEGFDVAFTETDEFGSVARHSFEGEVSDIGFIVANRTSEPWVKVGTNENRLMPEGNEAWVLDNDPVTYDKDPTPLDVISIAEALALPAPTEVITEGIITSTFGGFGRKDFTIQDKDGDALYIFTHTEPEAKIGDKIVVKGTRDTYNGLEQIRATEFLDIEEASPIAPTEITVTQAETTKQSVLVKLMKVKMTSLSSVNQYGTAEFFAEDTDGNKVVVRVDNRSGETFDSISAKFKNGDIVNVTGVRSQFNDTIQILPFTTGQIEMVEAAAEEEPSDVLLIGEIQGAGHYSPYEGKTVAIKNAIVTYVTSNSRFYLQDIEPDNDPKTSDGIEVYAPNHSVKVGDIVEAEGRVAEFIGDGYNDRFDTDLPMTQLSKPSVTVIENDLNKVPAPVEIAGDTIPADLIKEGTLDNYDPTKYSLDWWESVEGMIVNIKSGTIVGPQLHGDIYLLPSDTNETLNNLGGYTLKANENPNVIPVMMGNPGRSFVAKAGDKIVSDIYGPVRYSFGAHKIDIPVDKVKAAFEKGNSEPESTNIVPDESKLTVVSYNIENFYLGTSADKTNRIAQSIVNDLKTPDLLVLSEVQDDDGEIDSGTTSATKSGAKLAEAIKSAGGPEYVYSDMAPKDKQDGGAPGANIRVGFLYRPDRLSLKDMERIGEGNPAFNSSRKSLVGYFDFNGEEILVIGNHWNSKRGDDGLFGKIQPAIKGSEDKRVKIAETIYAFVEEKTTANPDLNVVVAGDFNDFEFAQPLLTMEGELLTNLVRTHDETDRYSYFYRGNSQTLDHILISNSLVEKAEFDMVHINSLFMVEHGRASDHDPMMVQLDFEKSEPVPITNVSINTRAYFSDEGLDSAVETTALRNYSNTPEAITLVNIKTGKTYEQNTLQSNRNTLHFKDIPAGEYKLNVTLPPGYELHHIATTQMPSQPIGSIVIPEDAGLTTAFRAFFEMDRDKIEYYTITYKSDGATLLNGENFTTVSPGVYSTQVPKYHSPIISRDWIGSFTSSNSAYVAKEGFVSNGWYIEGTNTKINNVFGLNTQLGRRNYEDINLETSWKPTTGEVILRIYQETEELLLEQEGKYIPKLLAEDGTEYVLTRWQEPQLSYGHVMWRHAHVPNGNYKLVVDGLESNAETTIELITSASNSKNFVAEGTTIVDNEDNTYDLSVKWKDSTNTKLTYGYYVTILEPVLPRQVAVEVRDTNNRRTDALSIELTNEKDTVFTGAYNEYKQWLSDEETVLEAGIYTIKLANLPIETKVEINNTVANQKAVATDEENVFTLEVTEDDAKVWAAFKLIPYIEDETVTEEVVDIPFETIYTDDPNLLEGEQLVDVEGIVGKEKIITRQRTVNGEPEGEPVVTREVLQEPVNAQIRRGTMVVTEKVEESFELTPFETVYEEDPNLTVGVEKIKITGVNGLVKVTSRQKLVNGQAEGDPAITREVILEPVSQVIIVGTKALPVQRYPDVPVDFWAYEDIEFLSELGILNGFPDGHFEPHRTLTRAEGAKIIAMALDLKLEGEKANYTDVSDSYWAKEYIDALTKKGIMIGYTDNSFRPGKQMTRAELALTLYRAFEIEATDEEVSFSDLADTHWAAEAIKALASKGIITGYLDGLFKPDNAITRAEASTMLAKALKIANNN